MAVRRYRKRRASGTTGRRVKRRMSFRRRRITAKRSRRQVHAFKRMTPSTSISGNAVNLPLLGVEPVQLNSLYGVNEFSALFDQYTIDRVVLKFFMRIDPSAQVAGSASFPRLYWIRDRDDSTLPPNIQTLKERQNCKMAILDPNRAVTISFRPNVLQEIYSSATTSTYSPKWGQWIDMADTAARHYGIKYAVDDFTNTNYRLDIERIFYFRCRDVL